MGERPQCLVGPSEEQVSDQQQTANCTGRFSPIQELAALAP